MILRFDCFEMRFDELEKLKSFYVFSILPKKQFLKSLKKSKNLERPVAKNEGENLFRIEILRRKNVSYSYSDYTAYFLGGGFGGAFSRLDLTRETTPFLPPFQTPPKKQLMQYLLCSTTIERDCLPINPFPFLAGQKAHHASDINRIPIASERRSMRRHLSPILVVASH